jgi:hypothetical protein
VLVTSDRVDIWIGDQSPQETRFSAAQITGIPEQNVHLHIARLTVNKPSTYISRGNERLLGVQ